MRLSRFAAGLRNLHNLLHQLDDAHVGLRSLVEPIDTTAPDGDLVIRAVDATLQLRAAWIAEVTTEGQTAARARGQRLGSPPKLTPEQGDLARQMHAAGHPAPSIAAMLKVATSTIYRHVRKPPTPSRTKRTDGLGLASEHGDVAGEQVANEERLLVRDVLDLVELAPLGGDDSHGLSGPFL